MLKTLIAQYHKTLMSDGELTASVLGSLKNMMRARRLLYGDREIGVALRPHLLTRSQYQILARSSEMLAAAFVTVGSALLSDQLRLGSIGLTEREIKMALVEPGYSSLAVTSRLDAFVYGDDVKFVEYNAENPSSLMDQRGLNEILIEIGAMKEMATHYQLCQFRPEEQLLIALLNAFREWGGTGPPNIAILDWNGLPTMHEFILLKEYFDRLGVRSIICAPEQLTYENERLSCGAFPIDLVYKRVLINELLGCCDDSHPLILAYVAGSVCLVNSFRCKLLHKKAVFELLTDEKNADWFKPPELEVIHRTVPWTRRVGERKTHFQGEEIDLIEYVRKHQALFVMKPNDDYGGRGITFGNRATLSEWETALSMALESDYVVQQKVELRSEIFPVFSKSNWVLQPMYVDTNPFLFNGRIEGAMVRLSDSPVVNVTAGGGETGFFVVEDKASSLNAL